MRTNNTNNIMRTITTKGAGGRLTLRASLNDECGNGYECFHLSIKLERMVFGYWQGCCVYGDDPRVRYIILSQGFNAVQRVVGCDMNGAPIHALQNAIYYAKRGERDTFQKYLRLTNEETEKALCIDDELGLYVWLLDNGVIARWKDEANRAIAFLEAGGDVHFASAATKQNGHIYFRDANEQDFDAARERIKSGYYSPDKAEFRLREERLAKVIRSIDNSIECSERRIEGEKLSIEFDNEMKRIFTEHFAEFENADVIEENSIFYHHSGQIAFNWRTFSDRVSDKDFELISRYLDGFCKKHSLTIVKKG